MVWLKRSITCLLALGCCVGVARADLALHWKLDLPGGAAAGDAVVSDTDAKQGIVGTIVKQGASNAVYGSGAPVVTTSTASINLQNTLTSNNDGAYLEIPDSDLLTGHANGGTGLRSLQIDAWINPIEFKTSQIVRKTDGSTGFELFLQADGNVGFGIYGIGGTSVVRTQAPLTTPGEWHHVIGFWDGEMTTDNLRITLDGRTSSTLSSVIALTNTANPIGIGALIRGVSNTGQFFNGQIDNVVITGRTTTAAIVYPETALVPIAKWSMELNGAALADPVTVVDDSIHGLLATPFTTGTTTVTYAAAEPTSGGTAAVLFSNPLTTNFDGSYLKVNDNGLLTGHVGNGTGFTAMEISALVRADELKLGQIVRKTDGNYGYFLYLRADGKVGFYVGDKTTSASLTSTNAITAGQWSRVIGRWDSAQYGYKDNLTLNVDGVVTSMSKNPGPLINTVNPLAIGAIVRATTGNNTGQFFNGRIDEVTINAAPIPPNAAQPSWVLY
jgi:hypothetical protein